MKKQPTSENCFVCGRNNPFGLKMTFYDNGEDEVTADYVVPEQYNGYPGVVHGGIVAAMLDEVLGRVAMINNPDRFFMTARLEVKYRQPVPTETPLKLKGNLIRLRSRIGKAKGYIATLDGTILAEGSMTLVDAPAGMVPETALDAVGWRVDPD